MGFDTIPSVAFIIGFDITFSILFFHVHYSSHRQQIPYKYFSLLK